MKTLDFAIYYDISEVAKKHNPGEYEKYEGVYMCVDVHDVWISKILKGVNEYYEDDSECCIIERSKVPKLTKTMEVRTLGMIRALLDEEVEDECGWDVTETCDVGEALEMLDGGFGVESLDID